MARSLRDLIEFLLVEISLCGERGASPADVLAFIDDFYAQATTSSNRPAQFAGAVGRTPNVDRKFKQRAWVWLTRHPEVSVGQNREGNSLSLDEVESRCTKSTAKEPFSNSQKALPSGNGGSDAPGAQIQSDSDDTLRVFVSEERMWLAIAGHERDHSRVPPLEFVLLSIIASRKWQGIMQLELPKLSGQDKRSVPKRTDSLSQKGYIEKKAVQVKSSRTSLCTLRQFVRSKPSDKTGRSTEENTSHAPGEPSNVIDFPILLEKLFNCLKEFKVITRNDLRAKLGMEDRWRGRILGRAIRKLERIGCVRRVRAISHYSDKVKTTHLSVMLIRELTENDLRLFLEDSRTLTTYLEQEDLDAGEMDQDQGQQDTIDGISEIKRDVSTPEVEYLEQMGRVVPRWTPDKILPNLIFDIVHKSGREGNTNHDINIACMGSFYRRPVEYTVSRLVETWQVSQPLHLRHLALVRDVGLRGTNSMYIHYSLRNFSSLVEEGQVSWEAVKLLPEGKFGVKVPSVDATFQADEHGFPVDRKPSNLLKNGDATLRGCLEAAKPSDYTPKRFDPVARKQNDGGSVVIFRGRVLGGEPQRSSAHFGLPDSSAAEEDTAPSTISRGRKRKVVEGDVDQPGDVVEDLMDQGKIGGPSKRQRKVKGFVDPYAGMTEKEKLEAQGFDETWTEYSVLLLERSGPGIFLTPPGKRRPIGKARGRPGRSRIAVVKSEKLRDLDWFVSQQDTEVPPDETTENLETSLGAVNNEEPIAGRSVSLPHLETETSQPTAASSPRLVDPLQVREDANLQEAPPLVVDTMTSDHIDNPRVSNKRKYTDMNGDEETSIAAQTIRPPPKRRGRPPRKARQVPIAAPRGQEGDKVSDQSVRPSPAEPSERDSTIPQAEDKLMRTQRTIAEDATPVTTRRGRKRKLDDVIVDSERPKSPQVVEDIPSENNGGSPSEALLSRPTQSSVSAPSQDVSESNNIQNDISQPSVENKHAESGKPQTQTPETTSRASEPVSLASAKTKAKKLDTQGGSIAFLRRKIVMDVVESSGGVYPYGTELWYPFTTAWLKTKQTERPDFRTLRNTVKYMTESRKLRQITFSGRNSKGLVVTKSIIAKPEILATDPAVIDLERAMLLADPQPYFPPGPEIDPSIRKSHKITQLPARKLPEIEEEVTVTLHQPPARSRPPEMRPPRVHKPKPGPIERLRSTKRRSPPYSVLNWLTSPNSSLATGIRAPLTSRRHPQSTAKLPPYAIVLHTSQSFHAPTGTFGTTFADTQWRSSTPAKPRSGQTMTSLPGDLGDILSMTRKRQLDMSNRADPVSTQVFSEIDAVGRWESRHPELFDLQRAGWRYINHGIPGPFESAPLDGSIRFEANESPRAPKGRAAPLAQTSLQTLTSSSAEVAPSDRPSARQIAPRVHKRPDLPVNRRLEQFQEPKAEKRTPKATAPNVRRHRLIKVLSSDIVQKLTVAIVVIRTLVGGLEGKMVDWQLVTLAFPDHDPRFIRDRGKAILSRNRLQMSKMQSDFQDRFAEAYERDQVPRIDYGDLAAYDWQWIVDWASKQLEGPRSDNLPSLPATRQQFNSLFDVRPEPVHTLDELYQHNAPATIPRKQALLAGTNFVIPLTETSTKRERQWSSTERLNMAKTWVRANVITPEESYNPAEARRILECLGEELIGQAIQSLITERVISMGNRGRITPGRNYDVTEYFVHTFGRKRAIEATQLKRAVTFKTNILDTQLHLEGKCAVNYDAEDGDILVLINLFAEGRVTIWPKNPPRDKYGLTDGGYLTRLMDKGKLRFDVEVLPVPERYIYGNPVKLPQAAPRGDMPADFPSNLLSTGVLPLCKIPLWFDIHGNFVKMLWDLVVAAVVGYLASRPGLSAAGISRIFQPHIAEWEVALVLEWMEEAGVVERLGGLSGWAVKEWWWMVVQD
ncbi:transcription factor C subunit 3 [Blastomyces parvus]|uniref:Transcription factor C subunit 3 n=1 Tax=Blastomyces parvus TaxID=2060905 RepID=A0A2B7X4H2_9EURO|nr:transcription factor C subunit 3 [Blastomyces parvus]